MILIRRWRGGVAFKKMEGHEMVEMFPVASSRITEMGYDPETATVYVRFTDGRSWCYMNVPQDVWDQFVASPSKGQFIKETLDAYQHGPAGI
jgi:hypothetical protein